MPQTAEPLIAPSRFDWQAPPFQGGRSGARMNLAPAATAQWLTVPITAPERAYKLELLRRYPERVFARWAGELQQRRSEKGEQTLYDLAIAEDLVDGQEHAQEQIKEHAQVASEGLAGTTPSPLVTLALQVPEDLCLMWRHDGGYRLLSACLCQPSYWTLAAKLGESLRQIHEPVADLGSDMAGRMDQFFERLTLGQVFTRSNWFAHGDGAGYQPHADQLDYRSFVGPWYLRSERQSLRRIDSDLIAFAIRVDLEPLAEIQHHPRALADLQTAVATLSDSARADFGGNPKQERLLATLAALRSASAEPPDKL